jgi:hypothetical protein
MRELFGDAALITFISARIASVVTKYSALEKLQYHAASRHHEQT